MDTCMNAESYSKRPDLDNWQKNQTIWDSLYDFFVAIDSAMKAQIQSVAEQKSSVFEGSSSCAYMGVPIRTSRKETIRPPAVDYSRYGTQRFSLSSVEAAEAANYSLVTFPRGMQAPPSLPQQEDDACIFCSGHDSNNIRHVPRPPPPHSPFIVVAAARLCSTTAERQRTSSCPTSPKKSTRSEWRRSRPSSATAKIRRRVQPVEHSLLGAFKDCHCRGLVAGGGGGDGVAVVVFVAIEVVEIVG